MTGEELEKIRHSKDLTQEEFAAKIGSTRRSVSKWENMGKIPVKVEALVEAAFSNAPAEAMRETPTPYGDPGEKTLAANEAEIAALVTRVLKRPGLAKTLNDIAQKFEEITGENYDK